MKNLKFQTVTSSNYNVTFNLGVDDEIPDTHVYIYKGLELKSLRFVDTCWLYDFHIFLQKTNDLWAFCNSDTVEKFLVTAI